MPEMDREANWKNPRTWARGHKSFQKLETPRKPILPHSPRRKCLVPVLCCHSLQLTTMCCFKLKWQFAMGMNRGASEPRASLNPTHSLPDCDCITTKRHLFFLPEPPQVAHSHPSPVALKTSQIGQISCVKPLETQYAWALYPVILRSRVWFIFLNTEFPAYSWPQKPSHIYLYQYC